jgi:hypothetical protein
MHWLSRNTGKFGNSFTSSLGLLNLAFMCFSFNCWNIRQQVMVYKQTLDTFPFHTFDRPDVALASKLILGSLSFEKQTSPVNALLFIHL